jgi:HSP20 family protein
MNVGKLAPWNWFKKEEETEGAPVTVQTPRQTAPVSYAQSMSRLHDQIDRLFEDVFSGFRLPGPFFGGAWPQLSGTDWLKPTLDIAAAEKEYTVSVELPGVEQKDVRLEVVDDVLRITGEKKRETEERDKDFYRVERSYGSFSRTLCLPEDADVDGISAVYKNGVMKISIPRKAAAPKDTKRIEIKEG